MTIPLQKGIIYGPVNSRRLGFSLGLNLLGPEAKQCTFNCVYCQYGWTEKAPGPAPLGLPSSEEVLKALEEALARLASAPQYITFSGNGEPTLHPDFPALVDGVVLLRDRLAPQSRVAVLSNSSTVDRAEVRQALARLDVRIMKLDAGTEGTYRRFNRVMTGIDLETIVQGLADLEEVTIQTLFAEGPSGNWSPAETESWLDRLKAIGPKSVQIYTLARSYPSPDIRAVGREEMESLGRRLKEAGLQAAVY